MELIVPPTTHHWELFSRIGYLYQSQAMVKGEIFSPYLGLAGLAGLIWIMVEALQAMMRRGPRRVPVQALQCVWVLLYATLGGMNCLLGLAGIMFFRASNRYSVIIATLALLFLAMRLSRLSLRWPRHVSWVAAGVVAMVALTDQLPVKTEAAETTMLREHVNNDERLAKEMEAKLPVGAAVFQMPAMVFPEALPIGQLLGYEMFAPYVYTKHLRFSFGSTRGRTREEWQWEVEKMPVPQMIESLEKFGFSAIYINRKAYADHADDLLKKLGEAGCKIVCEDDMHDLICVELKPSSSPELPHTDDRAQIVLKKGWIIHERTPLENQQWSDGDASLTFFTDQKQVTSYSLKCGIGSISLRHVSIEIKGHEVWSGEIPAGKAVPVVLTLDGWPGNNTIQFKTDQPPVKPNDSAPPLAFTVINLQIIRELPH
ncbi:MAG TPA: hypothetical protein VG754_13785 [Verrucomicrobiae bacterium]|nr:hypothetical protein [Verrucomicrobiae bacterium]